MLLTWQVTMFNATLRSDSTLPRMQGRARVRFGVKEGKTSLIDLHQSAPLRVLFPHVVPGEITTAALTTTAGGVVGGDRLDYVLEVGAGAKACFMAQAAEKIYRSLGEDAKISLTVKVEEGGWGEYLPQETILFDGARLERCTVLNVATKGSALAGEILAFGRKAKGEIFRRGKVREVWEVRRDNRLIWADGLVLENDIGELMKKRATFDGACYTASLLLVTDDPDFYLPFVRDALSTQASATIVNSVLLVRWLSSDAIALRSNFAVIWGILREKAASLPFSMPRLWTI